MRRVIAIIVSQLMVQVSIFSHALNGEIYGHIREYLVLTTHAAPATLKTRVDTVTENPVPYLTALAEDASLRIYARQKAISLLRFYKTNESQALLEDKLRDGSAHSALRKLA